MRSKREWLECVREIFRLALPDADVLDRLGAGDWRPDLVVQLGRAHLVLELEVVGAPRIAEVQGQMAKAVLQLRKHAPGGERQIPVVVVGLNRFGAKLEQAVRGFMEEYAPQVGWGLMDEREQRDVRDTLQQLGRHLEREAGETVDDDEFPPFPVPGETEPEPRLDV